VIFELRPGVGRPVFVPHTSWGRAQTALSLAAGLTTVRPIYAIQAAYYGSDHPAPGQLTTLAASYVLEVRAIQPRGPYSLAGYSFGGLIAYEMARQLVESGERVDLLGMVDVQADAAALRPLARLAFRIGSATYRVRRRLKRVLNDPGKVLVRLDRGRGGAGNPETADPQHGGDLPQDVRHSVTISDELEAGYRPLAYPGDAVLLVAEKRPADKCDPRKIWSSRVTGTLRTVAIPGEHGRLTQDSWDAVGAALSPLITDPA
jgi:acetoacetyl-CoA synthetase